MTYAEIVQELEACNEKVSNGIHGRYGAEPMRALRDIHEVLPHLIEALRVRAEHPSRWGT